VGQTIDRDEVAQKDTWKLQDIYASEEAWASAKNDIADKFDEVTKFKGKLATSPQTLLECLDLTNDIRKELGRLYSYSSMQSDQDTRVSQHQGMKQAMRQVATDYGAKASFIAPEITSMDTSVLNQFLQDEPRLQVYRMYLHDLMRTKAHLLSAPEEKILAETGLLASGPSSINSIFSNAEIPFPTVTLSDGSEVKMNQAGFSRFRALPNRADREKSFQEFFSTYAEYRQTFGAQLAAQVNKDIFYARARSYDSSLHSALDANNIPVDVYHSLIRNVNENLASFHRYLKLKQRMLGVEQLKYSDVYAPVVENVDLSYPFDEAMGLVVKAVLPLGDDYAKVVRRAYADRWIDIYPTPGKRTGAYCNGSCYDVHPYVLLNYNGRYDDVSTLAHELGHAMHSYYSNEKQPFATADYSTFVAEVASTLNEALLIDHVLKTIDDDKIRLSLLMNYLDGIKGTVFRQTQFAEFELAMHEKAEAGEPLTGDSLTEMYGDILKRYYGHDQGVCHIDELYCIEWAYVPHFYYNFYVYQYSTSFTASTAMSERILAGDEDAVEKAVEFLSAGGSDYPVPVLKRAGVDMLTNDPFDRTMRVMNRVMDQIEEILERQG
jgi:oligoendopeptidase F